MCFFNIRRNKNDIRTSFDCQDRGFFRTELLTEDSTKWPEPSIEDYAEKSRQTVAAWKNMSGSQGGAGYFLLNPSFIRRAAIPNELSGP